jgi:hypothetical protein
VIVVSHGEEKCVDLGDHLCVVVVHVMALRPEAGSKQLL